MRHVEHSGSVDGTRRGDERLAESQDKKAVAQTIENDVPRPIIGEHRINSTYFDESSNVPAP
jgi:hypothetical protein